MDYHTKKSIRYAVIKDINYKDDSSTDSKNDDNEDNVSEYVPSIVSGKSANHAGKKHCIVTTQKNIGLQWNKNKPSWQQVSDNVVLCGKQSLHCQNPGNITFREYVNAAD